MTNNEPTGAVHASRLRAAGDFLIKIAGGPALADHQVVDPPEIMPGIPERMQ